MNWHKALCALSIAFFGSVCIAQDITDVEAKPYGSYTGGAIDTVDLATGNLMLNIPLISFPQRGTLPPLSFSVELNNAPYSQGTIACGPDSPCDILSSRYDTSPPGAVYLYNPYTIQGQSEVIAYPCPYTTCNTTENWDYEDANIPSMGAYLTSSFIGGIVTGQINTLTYDGSDWISENDFSLVDPSGTTHTLLSDTSSWNRYRTSDGSGYTFIPSYTPISSPSGTLNAYDPSTYPNGLISLDLSQPQIWLENASAQMWVPTGGVRLGTIYSPTGNKYTNTIQTFPQVNANNIFQYNGTGLPYYIPQALIFDRNGPFWKHNYSRSVVLVWI